jgi:HEAT repeat protein
MRKTNITALVAIGVLHAAGMAQARAADQKKLPPVKVYILAGQSNAEERGDPGFLKENFPEYTKERPNLWHYRPAVKAPSPFLGDTYGAYGVEFASGCAVADAVPNDVIFMTSAVGGTTLDEHWRPPGAVKRLGGKVGDLYLEMIRHTHNLIANLDELYPPYKGQGYELAGFIWFQGENDCCAKTQGYYRDSLRDLIDDTRTDLGVPELPVALVKINDSCWGPPAIDIWAANEHIAHTMRNVVTVNTRDLRELCHYDSQSYLTIGQRLGKVLLPFARKPVPQDTAAIRQAAEAFFARTSGTPGSPDVEGLKKGLVEYWKLDELNPKSALENGTNGRTWSGSPQASAQLVKGKFGNALKVSAGQKIDFPGFKEPVNKDGLIEQMTVAFWARATSSKSIYRIGKGVGQKLEPVDGRNWYWSRDANRQGWDLRGFDAGNVSFTGVGPMNGKDEVYSAWTSPGFCDDGLEWRHQVLVYDALKKECRFYSNGEPCAIRASTIVAPPTQPRKDDAPPLPTSVAVLPLKPADVPLTIGGSGLNHPLEFQAYDELAIWSRALSEPEVRALYNGGAGVELIPANPMTTRSVGELQKIVIVETDVDAEIRFAAVDALAAKGHEALPQLKAALHDQTAYVRYRAAQAMGEMGPEMTDYGLTLLQSYDQELRVLGAILFKHMARKADPASVVPALAKALSDPHFDVRLNAADALGVMGDWAAAAVPALIKAGDDEEWWVRDSANLALSKINTPEARRMLIPLMTQERHSALWFQAAAKILEPAEKDPALQHALAVAYGEWLQKGEGWTAPFAARGKFGYGINGLERLIKQKTPIPPEVGRIVEKILKGEIEPLWPLDDGNRARLKKIQETFSGDAK